MCFKRKRRCACFSHLHHCFIQSTLWWALTRRCCLSLCLELHLLGCGNFEPLSVTLLRLRSRTSSAETFRFEILQACLGFHQDCRCEWASSCIFLWLGSRWRAGGLGSSFGFCPFCMGFSALQAFNWENGRYVSRFWWTLLSLWIQS